MRLGLVSLAFLVLGCTAPEARPPAASPRGHWDTDAAHDDDAAPSDAQVAEPERVSPCVPVVGCRIVGRHSLTSPYARALGGRVGRPDVEGAADWPPDATLVEVTSACGVEGGFYVESEGQIWLSFCFGDECRRPTLTPIESPIRLDRFHPVGGGFFADDTRAFYGTDTVEEVDAATFHACEDPPEDLDVRTFAPVAEDSRGLFGFGDCGWVIRAH
jgi:hypothetical protein